MAMGVATVSVAVAPFLILTSIASAVIFKSLPIPKAEELVVVRLGRFGVSIPDWQDICERSRVFAGEAVVREADSLMEEGDRMQRVAAGELTPGLLTLLGSRMLVGRATMTPDEHDGVILTEDYWRGRFGGRPEVVGSSIRLDGTQDGVVIGVVSRDIRLFPLLFGIEPRLYLFVSQSERRESKRTNRRWSGIGRLRPGLSILEARTTLATVFTQLKQAHPRAYSDVELSVVPLPSAVQGNWRRVLVGALVAASLVVLAMVANLSGLFLVRTTSRMTGMAIRRAVGAPLSSLRFDILVEGVVIASLGAGVGLLLAVQALSFLQSPSSRFLRIARLDEVTAGGWLAEVAVLVGVAVGILATAIPALRLRDASLGPNLNVGGVGLHRNPVALLGTLVTIQITLVSLLLLASASLTSSLLLLMSRDIGFQYRGVASTRLTLPYFLSKERESQIAESILSRVRALPGVASVATSFPAPGRPDPERKFEVVSSGGLRERPQTGWNARLQSVSRDYFETLRIRLRQGRFFSGAGFEDNVVIINSSLARSLSEASALGAEVVFPQFFPNKAFKVIGVVDDTLETASDVPSPTIFLCSPSNWLHLLVRSNGNPIALPVLREVVGSTDKTVAVDQMGYLDDQIGLPVARTRIEASSVTAFALIALCLSAVGIFTTVSLSVSLRMKEFGIRLAVGATPRSLRLLILRFILTRVLVGLLAGIVLSEVLVRSLSSEVQGLQPNSPVEIVAVAVFIGLAAVMAVWKPVDNSGRVDPAVLIRAL